MTTPRISPPSLTRRSVRSFNTYADAERAVDYLADEGFPVEHVTIVGTGLRYVEQVVRRVTNGRAALAGLGYGGMLGLFWGLLFGLFFTVDSGSFLGVLGYSVLVGLVFGAVFGLIGHLATGGRRDFASVNQTVADRYEVEVEESYAASAEKMLSRVTAAPQAA
ncbi:MAG TPA: general stress protein [Thermoleophilaceae bacterium]|nr:general stress protein [Thermoleophilaceae bacterium]